MAHALLDGVVQQHRFLGSERLLEGRNHASLENRPLLHPGKSLLGLGATKTEKIDRRLRDGGSIFGTKEEKHLNEMLGVTSEKDGIGRKLKLWMVCVRDQIQPQGDSHNDDSLDQRVLNVVTSLPFLALGGYMMRCVLSRDNVPSVNSGIERYECICLCTNINVHARRI